MAISIYYTVERRTLLNDQELALVSEIVRNFSVDQDIEQYLKSGNGLNWESFDISTNTEAGNLFKNGLVITGATKLPDNEENATWIGLQHWCNCLSKLRNAISECNWKVYVEDHEIQSDNEENATWIGLQHWCNCLSKLRNAISECNWKVYVEDHEIQWDNVQKAYDPSR